MDIDSPETTSHYSARSDITAVAQATLPAYEGSPMLKDDNIEYPGIAEDDLTPTQADTKGQPATTEIADPGAGVGRPTITAEAHLETAHETTDPLTTASNAVQCPTHTIKAASELPLITSILTASLPQCQKKGHLSLIQPQMKTFPLTQYYN